MDERGRNTSLEYRFHDGARSSLAVVAVLCFVLIAAAPVAIWVLIRRGRGKVRITPLGVEAIGLGGTTAFRFDEVAHLGLAEVPIVARGIGGALVRRRVGGDKAIHLVVKTRAGKTLKFIVSSYENYRDIIANVGARCQKPYEPVTVGLFGLKGPGPA